MRQPLLCVDNLLSVQQYPSHVLTAEENTADAWKVANARRSSTDFWTATTANSQTWLTCVFDRVRAFDFVALDRGHNLAGKGIDLLSTLDATDFSGTYETVLDLTLPAVSLPGDIDDALGVRTEEGAWVKRVGFRTATAIRFRVDAMGAGLLPLIVGLWIGKSWAPERTFDLPWDDDGFERVVLEQESDAGWLGRGPTTRRRNGQEGIRFTSEGEYDAARAPFGLLGMGVPFWLLYEETAEQAVLAVHRNRMGAEFTDGWWNKRRAILEWMEWEPKP